MVKQDQCVHDENEFSVEKNDLKGARICLMTLERWQGVHEHDQAVITRCIFGQNNLTEIRWCQDVKGNVGRQKQNADGSLGQEA